MNRFVDGEREALGELYRRMAPRLRGYVARLCRDPVLAEDVVQTTFAKVQRARASYARGAPVAPWVLVIARRALYDELRAERARGELLSDDGNLPEPPASPAPSGDDARALRSALAELPGHYREAILLTKVEGMSGGEAARALSTTESAVKLRVHRGYQLLRRRLLAEAA